MKQHRLFRERGAGEPQVRNDMQRIGHFEFGLDRPPVNFGCGQSTRAIMERWAAGDEVGGPQGSGRHRIRMP